MIRYTIEYSNPSRQYIPITATFPCAGKKEILVQFPVWRPGRYELGNFAKNVKAFKVTNEKGKLVPFEKISKDCWRVGCDGSTEIKVSYHYFAADLNAGSTFMDDRQLYVNPVNCVVYVKDFVDTPCELLLNIPENFTLACAAEHDGKTIRVANYHELADSPFIAGIALQLRTYTVEGVQFHLWFHGDIEPEWDKLLTDFEKFTRIQMEHFGNFRAGDSGLTFDEYHFLFQILPIKAYHGVEHLQSTVIALGPGQEVMRSGYDDLLGVSSHELYHTWNIKAIRPIEMCPYDYSRENFSRLGYVAEGVTTYLGDLFLCLSDVMDFGWYKIELEKLLQKHFDNFGRFNYSVAESSWDTWLDGYVLGAPDRKVSIYNEGALLSLSTDLKIRFASNNKSSIHDVMRKLYQEFALNGLGYSEDDFQKIVSEFAGADLSSYFTNYYYGTHSFESLLTEILSYVGLEIVMTPNPLLSQSLLGVKIAALNGRELIQQIYPGGTAELAGLMINDEIVAVNGIKSIGKLDELLGQSDMQELTLTVSRMGRILESECPHTNKSYFPVYTLKKSPAPSSLHKRIFKAWCGTSWDDCVL